MSTVARDDVRRYLNLPYRIAVMREGADEDQPWRAIVEELPGCEVRGSTPADATARIPSALAEWVADAQADGREVPEPRDARNYSGRLLLRMSKTLHSELAQAAERDQVSLNAYINYVLATALQHQNGAQAPAATAAAQEEQQPVQDTARLQRFLAIALAANVAVAAAIAIIAVVLLIAAS